MSIGSSPPQSGPMLSPDGKWVWDGTQWQPIAQRETVFPSWQSIAAEAPVAAAAPVPAPVISAAPMPALNQPMNPLLFPQATPAAPVWRRGPKPTGMNNYLYLIAGVVGIVIIVVVLNSVFPLWLLLPGPKAAPEPPAPQATPGPSLSQRSDFARADFYANVTLPSVLNKQALNVLNQQCTKQLTNSCQDALTTGRAQIKSALAVMDKSSIPLCVAQPAAKVRADVVGMDSALQVAVNAFTNDQGSELAFAMGTYTRYLAAYNADLQALSGAAKSRCDPTLTGP